MGISLADLFAGFETARRSAGASRHSLRAARCDFTVIHSLLEAPLGTGDIHPAAVTVRRLRRAFDRYSQTHAPASTARVWSTWNQFYRHLIAEGAALSNPLERIERPKVDRPGPKPLRHTDAERLLAAVAAGARWSRWPWPERDAAFLATGLHTGLAHSELLALDVGSVAGPHGARHLTVAGPRARTVPVDQTLQEMLDRYRATRRERFPGVQLTRKSPLFVDRRGDRLKRGGAHYLVEKSYEAAGLTDRVPAGAMVHALRHTFATRLAEDGADATEIQALLGHESLNTSQGYIDATANRTREAARANRIYRTLERITQGTRSKTPRSC